MSNINENDIWNIYRAFFAENNVISNQLDSFNNFVNFGMQEIVDQEPTIAVPNYSVKFGQISVSNPKIIEDTRQLDLIYPNDCRLKDINYDAPVYCDILETFNDGTTKEEKLHRKVVIGRMPIMVKSSLCNLSELCEEQQIYLGECPNDYGGYFIIKGHERVLTSQLRANYNQIFVLKQKSGSKHKYIAEVRSMSNETGHSVLVKALLPLDNRQISFSLPYVHEPIPVGIVFKALGFLTDNEITDIISIENDSYIKFILRDSYICQTVEQALEYIGHRAINVIPKDKEIPYAKQVVESELFPHLGATVTAKENALFLGYMLRQLFHTDMGMRNEDDRDNYANKRVDVAGNLMHELFRNIYKKYTMFIKSQLEKRKQRPDILSIVYKNKSITDGFHRCLATGNWTVQKNPSYFKTGVSQVLDRMTYISTISHLRRIIFPIGKEAKNAAMRQIHPSQFGYICPCETPESSKVGIVLNFAITAKVSKKIPLVLVKNIIEKCKTITLCNKMSLENIKNYTIVLLNNVIMGFSAVAESTVNEIKKLRQRNIIDNEVSVTYDIVDNIIKIYCDEGRFIRPLFVVNENNKLTVTHSKEYNWKTLLKKNIVQYVDCNEIENSVIAMNAGILNIQRSDFCEIHPISMLGITASLIPFSDHSQSPRNCYQSSMGKQALGVPVLSYNLRTDTMLHVLHYPQRPLVYTKTAEILNINEMPSGINAIVAIACYSGYNQEDSVMLNYSAIERGLFCLTSYHTIDCVEKKRETYNYEEICLPPETSENIKEGQVGYFKRKNANYSLLDQNGIVRARTATGAVKVKKGDVIIGKILVTSSKTGEEKKTDNSVVIQAGEEGTIDRVHVTVTPSGYKLVKIVIRVVRSPTLGDKLASRAAQKGTIGMVYRQEDMPFSEATGIVPDIIINPLCMPSRMTSNQLIECLLGKEACFTDGHADATPFTENSTNIADKLVDRISKDIQNYGFIPEGWEYMRNGMTGERLEAKIFMGPTYYQRLKHMVDDKMHARSKGHVTMLTRQPLEGRARDGGLRFGEMERDCMISHGAARVLKERLFCVSDPFQIPICKSCGIIASSDQECQNCKGNHIIRCNMPYASKLLHSELTSMGLKMLIKGDN